MSLSTQAILVLGSLSALGAFSALFASASSAREEGGQKTRRRARLLHILEAIRDSFFAGLAVPSEIAMSTITVMRGLWLLLPFNTMGRFGPLSVASELGRTAFPADGEVLWGLLALGSGVAYTWGIVQGRVALMRWGAMACGMLYTGVVIAIWMHDPLTYFILDPISYALWCAFLCLRWEHAGFRQAYADQVRSILGTDWQ